MKLITKVKLVNWQFFANQTIELNGKIIGISGDNGTGKSSLLDALQYLLLAGNVKFNMAANERSARSVKTYVRGKLGSENNEYLRGENVISHIAVEIQDRLAKKAVLGVVLELNNAASLKESYYYVENYSLIEEAYITKEKIINPYNELRKVYQDNGAYFYEFNTSDKKEIAKRIKERLKVNPIYDDLIKKAIAFKPINDVDEFIYNFLMDQNNLDLKELKSKSRSYHDLLIQIKNCEEKISLLEEIKNKGDLYLKVIKDSENIEYAIPFKKREEINNLIQNLKKEKIALEKEYQEVLNIKNNLIKEKEEVENFLNNEELGDYEKIIKKVEVLEDEKAKLDIKLLAFQNSYFDVKKLILDLNKRSNFPILNQEELEKYYLSHNYAEFKKESEYLFEAAFQNFKKFDLETNKKKTEIEDCERKIIELTKKRNELVNFRNIYDDSSLSEFVNIIKERMRNKKDFFIAPFCELIEIKDEKYRDVIEGFLNARRFNILVSPLYFKEVKDIYAEIKDKYSGKTIINLNKFEEKEIKENSLASYLTFNNDLAKIYASNLLGDVYLACDNNLSLKNNEATDDCFIYNEGRLNKIPLKNYNHYYIGKKASELALKNILSSLKDNENKYKKLKQEYDDLEAISDYLSKIFKLNNRFDNNYWDKEKDLLNRLNKAKKEKETLNNPELTKLSHLREERKEERNELVSKIDEYSNKMLDIYKKINEKETLIKENERLIKTYNELLKEVDGSLTLKNEVLNLISNNNDLLSLKNHLIEEKYHYKVDVEEKMKKYQDIGIFLNADIANLNEYNNELVRLKNNELNRYKERCEKAHNESLILFRSNYVNELRARINHKKDVIKKINAILAKISFGINNETYKIILSRANKKDKKFAQIYDILETSENYDRFGEFYESLSKEHKDCLDSVFNLISLDNPDNDTLKAINDFSDYRNFMSYDIKIVSLNDEGRETLFSKVCKERSGGEIQNPFYVIIIACFLNAIRKNEVENSLCPILFDEAFNNMDQRRIKALLSFYNNQNINAQIFIVVPPERMAALFSSSSSLIFLYNVNHYVAYKNGKELLKINSEK